MADASPLQQYIAVQRPHDQEMRRLLMDAAKEAEQIVLSYGSGTSYEKTRMLQAVRDLKKMIAKTYGEVGSITKKGVREAARAAANSERWFNRTLQAQFGAQMPELEAALAYSAENGINAVMSRLDNHVPLSKQVYRAKSLSSGQVADVVNRGLLLQKSAKQIANDVRKFISPNVPGGVSYAANRLARTEINNAFHHQQIASREAEPWTEGMHWNLSGSHPVPDKCNEYAEEEHFPNGGQGNFRKGETPPKPHPNCLCFLTTNTIDEDEFVNRFVRGEFDKFTDATIKKDPQFTERRYTYPFREAHGATSAGRRQ